MTESLLELTDPLFKQPENKEEEAQCQDAMESCPVEAIGDDGEEE